MLLVAPALRLIGMFAVSAAAAEKPNIILILTDDMGCGDIGCYGGKIAPTPNIDRMARDGTRFTQYYSASPICSPSRAAILTGMFPARWRITSYLQTRKGNRACEQADFLDPKAPSLARTLKGAGYATAHIGKWHLGGGRDVMNAPPFAAYGFDEHVSTYESPEPHADITATNWIWSRHDRVKRWERSAFFVDKTLDFLRRHTKTPCFVNLWPDDTHTPWVPDENAGKGDSIENLRTVLIEYDRQIGKLLAGLKELAVDERTLVIFTADNGALPTFGGARSGRFRGSKLSLYEGGIREPFIARWPHRIPAGRVNSTTVLSAVDLFASLCALADVPLSSDSKSDGEDLSSAFLGKLAARTKPLLWEYGRNTNSFAFPKGRDRSPNLAIREQQWKLLVHSDGTAPELYDVIANPEETQNLAMERPAIAKRLTDQVLAWRKSLP